MLSELQEDNLQPILTDQENVIVMYSAAWCGNCRLLKPKFKRMATENESTHFIIVDAEKFPESRKFANVSNLPTFAAFKNGVLFQQIQTNKEELLKSLVHEVANN